MRVYREDGVGVGRSVSVWTHVGRFEFPQNADSALITYLWAPPTIRYSNRCLLGAQEVEADFKLHNFMYLILKDPVVMDWMIISLSKIRMLKS